MISSQPRRLFATPAGITVVFCAVHGSCRAASLLTADLSTYADGPLVGQDGWTTTSSSSSPIINVVDGGVHVPYLSLSTATLIGQDARKLFPAPVTSPTRPLTSTPSVFLGTDITVRQTDVHDQVNVRNISLLDSGGFQTSRIVTRSGTVPGTFQFGVRLSGMMTIDTGWGTNLPLNTSFHVVTKTDLVYGSGNDAVSLYVNPDTSTDLAVPYAIGRSSSFLFEVSSIVGVSFSPFYRDYQYPQNSYDVFSFSAGTTLADVIVPEPTLLAPIIFFATMISRTPRKRTASC